MNLNNKKDMLKNEKIKSLVIEKSFLNNIQTLKEHIVLNNMKISQILKHTCQQKINAIKYN